MTDDQIIQGIQEAARMEHPWIPGAHADLIRNAAALLVRQQEKIDELRNLLLEAEN